MSSHLLVYTTPATSTHTSPISFSLPTDSLDEDPVHSNTPSDEEDINDYKQGGYYMVQIGDTFCQDRYVIESKMGWGYFSTVWLALDKKLQRHVALKIVKSDPHFCKSALEEIELLEQAQRHEPFTGDQQEQEQQHQQQVKEGKQHVAQLLDHFWHEAPEGSRHVCMVFEVLGESLLSVMRRFHYRGLEMALVKRMTRQMLQGLAFLHDCGIVHTDIKPENVLLHIPDVEDYLINKRQLQEQQQEAHQKQQQEQQPSASMSPITPMTPTEYGSTKHRAKRKMKRQEKRTEDPPITGQQKKDESLTVSLSGLSLNVPQSQQLQHEYPIPTILRSTALDCTDLMTVKKEQWHEDLSVKIVDLGNACRVDGRFSHVIQTRQYRSPEVIVGMTWNCVADIWSMGCLVFELLTGDYLFDPRADSKYGKDEDHLAKIIELMRVIPRNLTMGGDYSREFFNLKGELRHTKQLRYRRLRDVLHDTYFMPPEQADSISDFLSPMLEVDMTKRATAKEMLNHPWLSS